jgi:hypothetical protein
MVDTQLHTCIFSLFPATFVFLTEYSDILASQKRRKRRPIVLYKVIDGSGRDFCEAAKSGVVVDVNVWEGRARFLDANAIVSARDCIGCASLRDLEGREFGHSANENLQVCIAYGTVANGETGNRLCGSSLRQYFCTFVREALTVFQQKRFKRGQLRNVSQVRSK